MELEGKYGNVAKTLRQEHIIAIAEAEAAERYNPRRARQLIERLTNYKHPADFVDNITSEFPIDDTFPLKDTKINRRNTKVNLILKGNFRVSMTGRDDYVTGLWPRQCSVTLELVDEETKSKSEGEIGQYSAGRAAPQGGYTGFSASGLELSTDNDRYHLIVDTLQEALEVAGIPLGDEVLVGA